MKHFFQSLTLRGKLTFLITLTSCFILSLTFAAFMFFQWAALRDGLLEDAQVMAFDIRENCVEPLKNGNIDSLNQILSVISYKNKIAEAVVFDRDRQVLSYYRNDQYSGDGQEVSFLVSTYGHHFHDDFLDLHQPITSGKDQLGSLILRADLAPIYQTLRQYAQIGGAAFVIYSLVAFLLASSLQRLISDRVSSLAASMEKVSRDKDFSHRLQERSQDEIGQLFDGFNKMLAEIEKREKELQKNEAHLDFLAHHDPLTKLANRLLLHARLEHSLNRSKRLKSRMAMLFIDLDRFKNINDSMGHDIGDKVLCHVANCLQVQVREADTLARVGGDEFVIVIELVKKNDDLRRFVQKLLRELATPVDIEGQTLHVTATVGISLYPEDGDDIDSLMRAADTAMYQAKFDGRNRFQFFSPEMNIHTRESLLMENQLRYALEQEQMDIHYQPQYDLDSGHLVGFEALLRWQNADLGVVSPSDFIPLAEETGLIVPIGEWVLQTACQAIKDLQDKLQMQLRVAVNISPRQFQDESLVQSVAQALYRSQLPPQCLELEITESMVMDNVNRAISKMNEFKKMGVQLAIDDFGTGYSSLGYLKQFPISRLKIDQSFVRDLETSSSDQAIINSIIALGRTMNLEVIAEGIETVKQYEFLRKERCHQGQGFLMGRPLTEKDLIDQVDLSILCSSSLPERRKDAASRPNEFGFVW